MFGRAEFARLSAISVAYLYRLRQGFVYCQRSVTVHKTHPTAVPIGERRKPNPQGRCVGRISERYLIPVIEEILDQYPFRILGFHADNGSEYINRVVAELLEKLRIDLTKSRAWQTNDQALVEGKNGSVVRKQMGYGWIAQEPAEKVQAFYRETLNVYLNYHRPGWYATELVDRKGKTRKRYDKLKRLPQAEQYLRPGVTMTELERLAAGHSDTEYALLVQQEKARLFRSFAPRATVP